MRSPTQRRKPGKSRPVNFPAPTGGWIANRSLAIGRDPNLAPGAMVLDNWFPTSTGILLRRGSDLRYNIDAGPVRTMFRYVSGAATRLFAASETEIFDVSSDPAVSVYSGLTSGDWHVQQITTAGGTFLIGVNGVDEPWVYDGTTFQPISDMGSGIEFPSGSTASTSDLAFIWLYAGRLWFIQRDSMSAWYLPVDEVVGELEEIPLGGVFERGGVLLWGQSWSLSSGGSGGLSEQCVFTTTEGEVLAYQGQNPASASDWNKAGLYRIGKPLGTRAFVRAGGDLLIATSVGLISLAEASRRDLAALGNAAVSYPIEEAWSAMLNERGMQNWRCFIWPEGKMVIVSPPRLASEDPIAFVANANTGAWCRFTGWDMAAMETFNGQLHFGDIAGNLWIGNVSGVDGDAQPYVGVCIPLYEDLGAPASRKIARNGRVVKRSRYPALEKLTAKFDFSTATPPPPNAAEFASGGVWGAGIWGESQWGESASEVVTGRWVSLGGSGQDVSVCLQVTSGDVTPLDVELIRLDALFETAGLIS